VEPLSVGLGLLVLGFVNRSAGAKLAGMILTGIAGAGFFIASFISVFNDSVLRFAVPAMLVLSGLVLVGAQWFKREEPAPGEVTH